ncbi:MAG TPA: hypothetical protein VJM11_17710 [Nevskiaceae bacterium]|nr:hypothetical protein [Nevskiaceae bacterium]
MRRLIRSLPYVLVGAIAAPLQLVGAAQAGVLGLFADKPKEVYGPFEVTAYSSSFRVGDHRSKVTRKSYGIRYRGQDVRLAEPKSPNLPEPSMAKEFDRVYAIEWKEPVLLVEVGYPSSWRRQYLVREVEGQLRTELVFPQADNLAGEPYMDDPVRRLDADLGPDGEGATQAAEGQLVARLRGSSPWLLAGLYTVIDTRTLAITRLQHPEESESLPEIIQRSPDGNSFVRLRAYGPGLHVHDLPEGTLYTVPIDRKLHQVDIAGSEYRDPAWFDHFFEWQPPKQGGHYRLRARPDAKPLVRGGSFTASAGPRALEHYELNGDHTDLVPQVVATIERELGGVPVSAAERDAKMTRGHYIAAPGDYWWVGDSLVHFFAAEHLFEVRLLAGPSGPVERIAKRVDALVRGSGQD